MTDPGGSIEPPAGYSIDTSVLIDGRNRNYPEDVFPRVWENLEELVGSGRVVVASEVAFELERGSDDCHAWLRRFPEAVVLASREVLDLAAEITSALPEWVSPRANYADPWVIAHAAVRGWAVVTQEHRTGSPVQHKLKIPNVCERYDVPCLSFLDLARYEGWIF